HLSHDSKPVQRRRKARVDRHLYHNLDQLCWLATNMQCGMHMHTQLWLSIAKCTQRCNRCQLTLSQAQAFSCVDVAERELKHVASEIWKRLCQILDHLQARWAVHG